MAWHFDTHELRDAHGRWSTGGSLHKAIDELADAGNLDRKGASAAHAAVETHLKSKKLPASIMIKDKANVSDAMEHIAKSHRMAAVEHSKAGSPAMASRSRKMARGAEAAQKAASKLYKLTDIRAKVEAGKASNKTKFDNQKGIKDMRSAQRDLAQKRQAVRQSKSGGSGVRAQKDITGKVRVTKDGKDLGFLTKVSKSYSRQGSGTKSWVAITNDGQRHELPSNIQNQRDAVKWLAGQSSAGKKTTLNPSDANTLHRAGLGMFRPMGKGIDHAERLSKVGLLRHNESTGIYSLTEAGHKALRGYPGLSNRDLAQIDKAGRASPSEGPIKRVPMSQIKATRQKQSPEPTVGKKEFQAAATNQQKDFGKATTGDSTKKNLQRADKLIVQAKAAHSNGDEKKAQQLVMNAHGLVPDNSYARTPLGTAHAAVDYNDPKTFHESTNQARAHIAQELKSPGAPLDKPITSFGKDQPGKAPNQRPSNPLSMEAERKLRNHAAPYSLKLKSGHTISRDTNEFSQVPIRNVTPDMTYGISKYTITHPDGSKERVTGTSAIHEAIKKHQAGSTQPSKASEQKANVDKTQTTQTQKQEASPEAIDKKLEAMKWWSSPLRDQIANSVDYSNYGAKDKPTVTTVRGQQFKLYQNPEAAGGYGNWSYVVQMPDGEREQLEQAHDAQYAIADWLGQHMAKQALRSTKA